MGWRYRLDLEYDGTGFAGWQVQPDRRTVQGELQGLFRQLGEEARPTGAGRTDAGVHALGNAAHVDLVRSWEPQELGRALAALAPADMAVTRVTRADDAFHARFDAARRTYVYAFARREDPFFRHRRWTLRGLPEAVRTRAELAALEGPRDFASFACSGGETRTTRCRLFETRWEEVGDGALLVLSADRFLYGMVRAVAGTLVRGLERNQDEGFLLRVLEQGKRAAAGEAAPAAGLYLAEVRYPGDEPVERTGRVARLAGLAGPGDG